MTMTTLLDQAVCAGINGSDQVLIVGVGDDRHRDDGVGPAVVRRLCDRLASPVRMRALGGDAEDLRARWGRADLAVMVLAARHDSSSPGAVHMLATELPRVDTGAGAPLNRLGGLPHRVVVYTVEGASFAAGTGLSPDVDAVVDRLADHIQRQVAALSPARPPVPDQRGDAVRPARSAEAAVVRWRTGTAPSAWAAGWTGGAGPEVTPRM
jgi:hydrogenase maturation protease